MYTYVQIAWLSFVNGICKFKNVVKMLNIVCRKEMAARHTIPLHPIVVNSLEETLLTYLLTYSME